MKFKALFFLFLGILILQSNILHSMQLIKRIQESSAEGEIAKKIQLLNTMHTLLEPVRENIRAGNAFYKRLFIPLNDRSSQEDSASNAVNEKLWLMVCPETSHRINELENTLLSVVDHLDDFTENMDALLQLPEFNQNLRLSEQKKIEFGTDIPFGKITDFVSHLVDAYEEQDKCPGSLLVGPIERDLKDLILYLKKRGQSPTMKPVEGSYIAVSLPYQNLLNCIRGYCVQKKYTRALLLIK